MRTKTEHSKELDFYIQFIEWTDEEYLNYMKKTYWIDVEWVNDTLFWAYISAYKNNKDYCIVWCNVIDYNTIAHEVSHAILDIMKSKEIIYSEESKEIFTNYLWYWIERGILFFKNKLCEDLN